MTFKTISSNHALGGPRWYHCTACRHRWEALALQPCGKCASPEIYDLTHIPASTFDEGKFVGFVEYIFNDGASMVKNHGAVGAEVTGMVGHGAAVVKSKAGAPKEAFNYHGMGVAVDDWGRIIPLATSPYGTKSVGKFHRYIAGTVPTNRKPTGEELARAALMKAEAEKRARAELELTRKYQREEARIKAKIFVEEELDEVIAKLEGRDV